MAAARLIRVWVIVVLAALALAAPARACAPHTSVDDLENEVMCLVCGVPLSLATDSPQAQSERALIARLVARCDSKAQIERRLVAEYGSEVLASPPSSDVGAWLIPALVFAALAAGLAAASGIWRPRMRARG